MIAVTIETCKTFRKMQITYFFNLTRKPAIFWHKQCLSFHQRVYYLPVANKPVYEREQDVINFLFSPDFRGPLPNFL